MHSLALMFSWITDDYTYHACRCHFTTKDCHLWRHRFSGVAVSLTFYAPCFNAFRRGAVRSVQSRSQTASVYDGLHISENNFSAPVTLHFCQSYILSLMWTCSFGNFSSGALSSENSFQWIFLYLLWSDSGQKCSVLNLRGTLMYEIVVSTSIRENEWSAGSSCYYPWGLSSSSIVSLEPYTLNGGPYIYLSSSVIRRQLINDY